MADWSTIANEVIVAAQDEWQRALDEAFVALKEVFDGMRNPRYYLPSLKYPGVPKFFELLVDVGLEMFQTLFARIAQIPGRVALVFAAAALPMPKTFHHRVVPLDDAIRLSVKILIDQSLTVVAGAGVPPGILLKKKVTGWIDTWKFWRYFDLSAGLRLLKGKFITLILRLLSLIFFYVGVIFMGVLIYKLYKFANNPSNDTFFKRSALQQKNPLVHDTTLGRKRLRE